MSDYVYSFFSRFLIAIIITLGILIMCKKSINFKSSFYNKVYDTNFNFAVLNETYKKYFGSSIPFGDMYKDKTLPVFNETLVYDSIEPYLDGVSLNIGDNYLVPSLGSGLVIFIGEKDGYGKTVIIEGTDGIDIWYSNFDNISVNLYEYVKSGSLIGSVSNNLYLLFKKDGNILDYKEYLH